MCSKRLPNHLIKKSFRAYNTRRLFESLILLHRHMVGLFLLQCPKEHIQRAAVLIVLLPHLGKVHHVDQHFKILFLRGRFADEVEHKG